jgi:ribonuclease-3
MSDEKMPAEKKPEMKLAEIYTFTNPNWLEVAMTHKSYANERGATDRRAAEPTDVGLADNERLEFLGDSVLSASLSARLMREFQAESEGSLSKRRASLVNEERLAGIALRLGLQDMLKLGKGEVKTGGSSKPRILACGLEALIGAIFLDSGFAEADRVISYLFEDEMRSLHATVVDFERDYKTRFQEWTHGNRGTTPVYSLVDEFGPAHNRGFRVAVFLGETEIARGEGKSKKAAEQDAARLALEQVTAVPVQEVVTESQTEGAN